MLRLPCIEKKYSGEYSNTPLKPHYKENIMRRKGNQRTGTERNSMDELINRIGGAGGYGSSSSPYKGGGGGGGAGGNGGVIVIITTSSSIGTTNVDKGTKGSGGASQGGSTVGADGADGIDGKVIHIRI